jgi:cobalamin 5'-phosphate synthase/cobalamin synthase
MRLAACAVAFLTRLPVARGQAFDAKTVARAGRYFPLVGALVGGICWGALWLLERRFPPLVAAAAVVALEAWLTGAMHLDGLADTADGLGGGRTREAALRIMRDHSVGTYGTVAVALALALKVTAIDALIANGREAALVLAPALGRWAAVLMATTQPYARAVDEAGTGEPTRFMGRLELTVATLTTAALAAAFGWRGAAAGLAAAIAAAIWSWRSARRIGGVTGDTLGAATVGVECLVLALFTAAWR